MSNHTQQHLFPQATVETWRPVRNYENLYHVSDQGRVRYAKTRGGRGGTQYQTGALKKLSVGKYGYIYTSLTDENGDEKKFFIHRLVMEAFAPCEGMDDLDVNHEDGDKSNCRLSNLSWMTHRDNIMHARNVLRAWGYRKNYRLSLDEVRHKALEAILQTTEETYEAFVQRLIAQEASRLNLSFPVDDKVAHQKASRKRRPITVIRRLLF